MAKNDFDELMSVGIDIGKDVFHLVGFNKEGQLVLRKKKKRMALVSTFEELPRCIVGMEACMNAHFVSRTLRESGFEPRIIPAGADPKEFAIDRKHGTEILRPQSLTAQMVIIDLSGNEITARA